MSTTLEIPSALFERLQKFAIPLVDTPISVIEKLADHYEATTKSSVANESQAIPSSGLKSFNPLDPPDLLHTRVEGTLGDLHFRKWNELVRLAHVLGFKKAGSFEALRSATQSQIRNGNHNGDRGFHHIPEIGISVQGVDARHAWTYALCLAKFTGIPIRATVTWRNNEKAAFPGESGVIEWAP
jgi:hypothetical protein